MNKIRFNLFLVWLISFGCVSKPLPPKYQEAPKSAEIKIEGSHSLRAFHEHLLKNGLRVIYIPESSLPRVGMQLLLRVGSYDDPEAQRGLNSLLMNTMDQGTKTRSAHQIAEDLGQYAISFDASPGSDFSVISSSALSKFQEEMLNNFIDIVQNPSFASEEIERMRSQMVAAMIKRVDHPESLASVMFEKYLYGLHPYAFPVSGTLGTIKNIKRVDIIRHYFKYYNPVNMTLAVSGQYSDKFVNLLEEKLGAWNPRVLDKEVKYEIKKDQGIKLRLVHQDSLDQAQILIGHVGIQRKDPDYLALKIANFILGGGFTSRLNQRIRDNLGLTYSISSSMESRKDEGIFCVSTFSKNENVGQIVKDSLEIIDEFIKNGVTEEELKSAKTLIQSQFPTSLETPDQLAYQLLVLRFYGISDDYLNNFVRSIQGLNLAQVNKAISKHFSSTNLKVLIYGDAKKIKKQLTNYSNVENLSLQEYKNVFVK